jgi:glycosyltransferase involved in cell wall biosynthesis
MRIAFISFAFIEYSIKWAGGLAENDAEVLLVLPQDSGDLLAQVDPRVKLWLLPYARIRHAFRQIRNMFLLADQLRQFKPDVIHVQQGFLWFNLFLFLFTAYPLVITVHDPRPHTGDREQKTPHWLFMRGFRAARALIVHGDTLKNATVEQGLPAERVHVIPHIQLGDVLTEVPPPPAPPTLLFFGRIFEYKGLDYLIRAEPLIAAQVPNVKISIGGRGDDFAPYRAMMTDPSRYIVRNENIPDEDVAGLFLNAAVVVLPYIEATQSGVVPLAYTYARPVVATRVGGLPEAVEDGVTGILVPPRDVEALAAAIVRLLRDPALAAKMGAAGRRKIDDEASPRVVGAASLAVYQRARQA